MSSSFKMTIFAYSLPYQPKGNNTQIAFDPLHELSLLWLKNGKIARLGQFHIDEMY
jgi:hypothetical protein